MASKSFKLINIRDPSPDFKDKINSLKLQGASSNMQSSCNDCMDPEVTPLVFIISVIESELMSL